MGDLQNPTRHIHMDQALTAHLILSFESTLSTSLNFYYYFESQTLLFGLSDGSTLRNC